MKGDPGSGSLSRLSKVFWLKREKSFAADPRLPLCVLCPGEYHPAFFAGGAAHDLVTIIRVDHT
jgi:hypothetical protein